MARLTSLAVAAVLAASLAAPGLRAADAPDNKPPAPQPPQRAPRAPDNGDPGQRRPGPMNPFANQLDQMDRTLQLTEEQKPKIKEAVEAMNKELDDARQASMEKIREAMGAAQGNDGGEARRQIQEDMKKANDDFLKIITTNQAKISGLLTPEQRITWEGFKLARTLQQRFNQLDLTDDQKQQIKQLADAAGTDLASAKDPAAAAVFTGKLVKKIIADVLTDEQSAKLVTAGPPMMGGMNMGPGGPPRDGPNAPPRPNRNLP